MDNSTEKEQPMFSLSETNKEEESILCGKKREGSPLNKDEEGKPNSTVRKEQMKKNSKNYRHRMKEYIKEMEAKIE